MTTSKQNRLNINSLESYKYWKPKSEWKKLTFLHTKQFVKDLQNHSMFLNNPQLLDLNNFRYFYNKKEKAFYYCLHLCDTYKTCSELNYLLSYEAYMRFNYLNDKGVR